MRAASPCCGWQRIYNLLDEIKAQSGEKTYILVAHNGIARVVQSYFTDMTNEEFAGYGVKNCEDGVAFWFTLKSGNMPGGEAEEASSENAQLPENSGDDVRDDASWRKVD